jgi:hypothetical protein
LRITVPDFWVAHAGDGFEQFGLAVAGDTGNADDLAGAHGEADSLDANAGRASSIRRRGPRR